MLSQFDFSKACNHCVEEKELEIEARTHEMAEALNRYVLLVFVYPFLFLNFVVYMQSFYPFSISFIVVFFLLVVLHSCLFLMCRHKGVPDFYNFLK